MMSCSWSIVRKCHKIDIFHEWIRCHRLCMKCWVEKLTKSEKSLILQSCRECSIETILIWKSRVLHGIEFNTGKLWIVDLDYLEITWQRSTLFLMPLMVYQYQMFIKYKNQLFFPLCPSWFTRCLSSIKISLFFPVIFFVQCLCEVWYSNELF
jgi:hypothetical protein